MPLQLPRPTDPARLPPVPSTSSSPPPPRPQAMRAPPPSLAAARQQARQIRGEGKSPFVPRKSTGKERDLKDLSVDQLAEMFARNARLLESPETFASLPGGDSRLRSQQERIQTRLKELEDVSQMKRDLDATHLRDGAGAGGHEVKKEEDEGGEMEEVAETGVPDEAASPSAKRRIAAQLFSPTSGLTSTLSLTESMALQRAAVERARDAQEKKDAKMQLDARRPERTGELLRGAMGVDSALGEFMFQPASDSDPEPEDADIDTWLAEGRRAAGASANGQLNEEEDADLNPLRTAYMRGWNAAIKEEEALG
ncbi:hypothetical protein JCM10213_004371 [Rhodosporidiobolus nylandii]